MLVFVGDDDGEGKLWALAGQATFIDTQRAGSK